MVSPFLRCLQTAAEVVAALCAVANDEELMLSLDTSKDAVIDPSRVKVHIELGLCEVMGSHAMRISEPAKDEIWFPAISELESIFPAGTLDSSAERIYQQLPQWEEPVSSARDRYKNIIQALADKFPNENLLLVTHGEAVGVSVNSFAKGLEVFEVEYCALSFLQRSTQAENLRVLTESAQSGVSYYSEADKTP
ncbi:uncharacterized protein LOC109824935 [Asparagus officinalis]|nr:uncharacterized protein LOC109824935 [Asparagus officinalis]